MPDVITDTYQFVAPEIGGSDDTWGAKLNDNWAKLEALLLSAFEGGGPATLGTLKSNLLPEQVPGQEYSGTISVKNNNPQLRLEEEDQTDPNGRYRFYASGGNLLIQRSNAVAWASAVNLIQYNRAQDRITFGPAVEFSAAVRPSTFTTPTFATATNSDNALLLTLSLPRPWVMVQSGTGVNADLELRSTTPGNNNFRVMDDTRSNGVRLRPDIRRIDAVGGVLDIIAGSVVNYDRSASWPSFGVRRKDNTTGASFALSSTGDPADGWAISFRPSANGNTLDFRWQGEAATLSLNPTTRTVDGGRITQLPIALLRNDTGSAIAFGDVVTAGGNLKYASADGNTSGNPSSTSKWECLGRCAGASGANGERTSLFIRRIDLE